MGRIGFATMLLTVLVMCFEASAQTGTTSLRGAITDSAGAVVVDADVTFSNQATSFSRSVKSDSRVLSETSLQRCGSQG